MKRLIVIILIFAMTLALTACRGSVDPIVDPTAAPTENTTEAPTEAPTETPTPEPTEEPTPEPTEAPEGDYVFCDPEAPADLPDEAVFTVLLRGAYGDGEAEFGCDNYGETDGPNDFFIEDGKVVILDTMHKLVKVFEDGALIRTIDVSDVTYPFSMERFGDSLYVYNTFMIEYVCEYDWETGEFIRSFRPPEGIETNYYADALYVKGGGLCLMQGPGKFRNVFDPEAPEICEINVERIIDPEDDDPDYNYVGFTFTTEFGGGELLTGKRGSYEYIGLDGDGNAYFIVCWNVPDSGPYAFSFEKTLQKFSPEGKLIGIAEQHYHVVDHSPTREFRITEDGRIFQMTCIDGELIVAEIQLGRVYKLRTEEIRQYKLDRAQSEN
ncbi:MAG: hypothetical protein K6G56_02690 [Clostridiales bacterium]|nr:hypothetical protein [Clostridiales bacterium]